MSTTYSIPELQQIAGTIQQQVGMWPFAEVGARDFKFGNFTLTGLNSMPGLRFVAKPRHRLVYAYILLDPSDTYRVIVHARGRYGERGARLYETDGIYWDTLPEIIRNLPKEV